MSGTGFEAIKSLIEKGGYDRPALMEKLDLMFAYDRVTPAQYRALMERLTEDEDGAPAA